MFGIAFSVISVFIMLENLYNLHPIAMFMVEIKAVQNRPSATTTKNNSCEKILVAIGLDETESCYFM